MPTQDDRERASAATAALADIERQKLFVTQLLGGFAWLAPVVAVVLALAAASLAYRNGVLFVVVQVIYLAAFVPLAGTPVRTGVIPREGRGSQGGVFALCVLLLSIPPLAMLGPWWTAIVAGAGAGTAVIVLSRWRLAVALHEARSPVRVDDKRQGAFADRIVAVPAVIMIAVMGAGALAAASPDRDIAGAGRLAYFLLGLGCLFVRQNRIGELPPELRVGLVRKAVFFGVALFVPVLATSFSISLRGNWWVASCCALVSMLTAATIFRWQRHILRDQASAACPAPLHGANG